MKNQQLHTRVVTSDEIQLLASKNNNKSLQFKVLYCKAACLSSIFTIFAV